MLWRKGTPTSRLRQCRKAVVEGGRRGGGKGGMGGDRTAGNTAATPVSDGKFVAVLFGSGVAAVYEPMASGCGPSSSSLPGIEKGLSACPW